MKRSLCIALTLLLVLLCCACGKDTPPEPAIIDGKEVIVDKAAGTITHGDDVYRVQASGLKNFDIVYPDGTSYTYRTDNSGIGVGFGSGVPDERYLDEDTLLYLLGTDTNEKNDGFPVFFSLLLIIIGVWGLLSPQTAWYLSYGWRYKNAEPSDLALGLERIGGGIAVAAGVITLFV